MDLLTLVTVCSIGFEPRAMQALVLEESGGKPFSYRAADGKLRSFATMPAAIGAARRAQGEAPAIRVGLAGLMTNLYGASAKPNESLFEPCPNIALASLRLQKLRTRCGAQKRFRGHEDLCALAVWRGSWQRMDMAFASRVMTAAAAGEIPNPELAGGCRCTSEVSAAPGTRGPKSTPCAAQQAKARPAQTRDSGPLFVVRAGESAPGAGVAANGLFVPLSGARKIQ